ncbi:uncharacterized protein [Ptychodera flava]|uniref:uncharacterized protein n=1 Tax=Ptychodera flava TaxID=63121 RepID=UPI00396A0F08
MEILTSLFRLLTLLVLSRLSFQQATLDKTDQCFDSQYRCASENQCAYTFVLPRPNGETCPSVRDTVRAMDRLVSENEELKQSLQEIQGELTRLKSELENGQTDKSGSCPVYVTNLFNACLLMCDSDYDCPGRSKCCQNGCSKVSADPLTVSTTASTGSTTSQSTMIPDGERIPCTGYCSGSHKTGASCVNGFCQCQSPNYGMYTCLPVVGGCKIRRGAENAAATGKLEGEPRDIYMYSCVDHGSNNDYEVHVIGVYEGREYRTPRNSTVYIQTIGQTTKPIVLVLGTYNPINWVIQVPTDITIDRVISIAYFDDETTVVAREGAVNTIESLKYTNAIPSGYGDDSGGGDTVGLLMYINGRFGPVTSFSGTYKADEWHLSVGSTALQTTMIPDEERIPCTGYCSGSHRTGASCVNGFCQCQSPNYGMYTCLPVVGGCKIRRGAENAAATGKLEGEPRDIYMYSCVDHGSNNDYEVHVIGVYEGREHRTPRNSTVYIQTIGQTTKPIVLVFGTYEPINWVIEVPTDISIDRVISIAYYDAETTVVAREGAVNTIESLKYTNAIPSGFGDDSGGGDTVGLLVYVNGRFGPVTSFSGTYEWHLSVGV